MTLKDIILKNAFWLLIGETSSKILSYIIIVVLARILDDVGLGEYSFVFAFVGLTFLLADFGVNDYFIREASRIRRRTQSLFSNIFSLKLLFMVLSFIVTFIWLIFLDKSPIVIGSIMVFAAALSLENLGNVFVAIFQSRNKMHLYTFSRIIERLIALIVGIYVLVKYQNLFLLFVVLFIASLARFIYEFIYGLKFVKFKLRFDLQIIKEVVRGGIPLWLTGVFAFIYFRIDIIMLSLMIGDQVVGWYTAAYKLIDALNFIPYIVFIATFPSMSLLFKKNRKVLKNLLNRVIRYLIILAMPIIAGTVMLADRFIPFIYGESFTNSIFALRILIFAEALIFITFVMGMALNAMNREKAFSIALAILAVFNIGLNYVLIPKYMYIGAAFATVVTEILCLAILHRIMKKALFRVKYPIAKPLIATIGMILALYFLSFLAFWWLILIGIAVYCIIFILAGLEKEDKVLFKEVLNKFQSLKATR